jgi:hypothetical protein
VGSLIGRWRLRCLALASIWLDLGSRAVQDSSIGCSGAGRPARVRAYPADPPSAIMPSWSWAAILWPLH